MSFKVSATDLRRDATCSSTLNESRPFGSNTPFRRESFSRSPEKYGCRKAYASAPTASAASIAAPKESRSDSDIVVSERVAVGVENLRCRQRLGEPPLLVVVYSAIPEPRSGDTGRTVPP